MYVGELEATAYIFSLIREALILSHFINHNRPLYTQMWIWVIHLASDISVIWSQILPWFDFGAFTLWNLFTWGIVCKKSKLK